MKGEVIRVEPLSTYLERWKAPTSAVTHSGDTIYVSGFPLFDPGTRDIIKAPIERQTEFVVEQMKLHPRDLRPLLSQGPTGPNLRRRMAQTMPRRNRCSQ